MSVPNPIINVIPSKNVMRLTPLIVFPLYRTYVRIFNKRKTAFRRFAVFPSFDGDYRDRTDDLLHAMQALSQLS